MKEILNFGIVNNTNGIVPVSLFGNNADPMDTANATTQYSWNITGFSVTSQNTILLQYKSVNETFYSFTTIGFSGNTTQDIINALNTLNLGYFFTTTSGGNTYINNYNNNVSFHALNILTLFGDSTVFYSFNFNGVGLSAEILKNGVTQINSASPSFTSGSFAVFGGNTINFKVVFSGNTILTNYSVYDITSGTYLQNVTSDSGIDSSFSYTAIGGHSYFIVMQT
jgi:hypothetical protein